MLCLHAGLLVAASTKFSVLSWMGGSPHWTWDYFQYAYKDGWGYRYESDYSLLIVLTYIAAYLAGVAGYALTWKRLAGAWTGLAAILSALGLISFLIEGSHWLWEHHLSWIFSCPAGSLLLMAVVLVQLCRVGAYATGSERRHLCMEEM